MNLQFPASSQKQTRILSIDIMRGLTLFLMLFVNDLFVSAIPQWMLHTQADVDGMGLSDWVFPGFLFMVGISIPYAFQAREKKGESKKHIFYHILIRSISLIFIGLMIVNSGRINPDLSGITRLQWSTLLYICIFLVWNEYPKGSKHAFFYKILVAFGLTGLAILGYVFVAGTPESPQWLIKSWWGILGLLGWGYLTGALVYFFVRNRLIGLIGMWTVFLALNILSQTAYIDTLDSSFISFFEIILQGNVPLIVLSGLIIGVLVKEMKDSGKQLICYLLLASLFSLGLGFLLRNWFIISKIHATPSWGLICNGISIGLFTLIYYFFDFRRVGIQLSLLEKTGRNALTTYLLPDFIYFFVWGFGLPLFFYKQADAMWLSIIGSLVWAFCMLWFSVLLSKLHVRLKL